MNATADLSIITLISNASIVVKVVLSILVLLSLASWTVIFRKFFQITRATRQTDDFESRFWSGTELTKLLETANRSRDTAGMEERIFAAGMNEFMKQRQSPATGGDLANRVSRAMRAVYTREMDHLESGLPLLASIGSTSPYIGLFGTVWGIMNAFTGLSSLENASLAVVAPGIAEALVATAIGLFAAIPAVAAFNYYNNRTGRLSNRVEGFSEEFLNILERQSRG
ncbi:protein TolQ [Sutterella sp.]|uniref:protein TolQ n=1 Tax=Sutterella sp. TaxID=1981025 RepID=UPI0026E0155C|nr:protein TolQ [Sutterella sp.]MDO5530811.1 protein TolQ [Sutterella sp.]